jgi:hypothetical protein
MLDRLAALKLGYAPARVGFRFNAIEILQRLQPAEPPLLEVVNAWMTAINARGAEVVQSVLTVERLMLDVGLTPAERPGTYAQYVSWARAAHDQVSQALAGRIGEMSAFLLGLNLADFMTTVALEELVADLRRQVPEHPFLGAQAGALAEARARGLVDLRLAASSTGLPPTAEGVLGEIVHLAEAGMLDGLERKRPALEEALAP